MPTTMPPEAQKVLAEHFPETHTMWMIRGQVLDTAEIDEPPFLSEMMMQKKEANKHTLVQIEDMDSIGMGYDVRIEGAPLDFSKYDEVSLFGDVPAGEKTIGRPKLLINHATGQFWRCYDNIGDPSKNITQVQYKKSLAVSLPPTTKNRILGLEKAIHGWFVSDLTPSKDKRRNVAYAASCVAYLELLRWLTLGGGLIAIYMHVAATPWLAVLAIPAVLLFILAHMLVFTVATGLPAGFCLFIVLRLIALIKMPPRFKDQVEFSFADLSGWSNVTQYFGTVWIDTTYCYQEVVDMVHTHMVQNGLVETVRGKRKDQIPSDGIDDDENQSDGGMQPALI